MIKARWKGIIRDEYTLSFVKEDDGIWYIDFPEWPGDHANLAMVWDADKMLSFISQGTNKVSFKVRTKRGFNHGKEFVLNKLSSRLHGGATYSVSGLAGFTKNVWFCPVTLFVFGRYPKTFYAVKI